MGSERIHKIINALAINAETKHLDSMRADYDKTIMERPTEAEILLSDLLKECRRLDDEGTFDHEEVWFATGKYTKGRKK